MTSGGTKYNLATHVQVLAKQAQNPQLSTTHKFTLEKESSEQKHNLHDSHLEKNLSSVRCFIL